VGKIHLLGKNISELIAAGEVIERPASIIKELVENSIDANSTAITIEIKRGGISYIRITDNGSGIEKDDIPVAFKRHATSKIQNEVDLDNIATLGFRGEALASISAVSKMELTSKTASEQFGSRIVVEGYEEILFETVGTTTGTTIVVKDLFYNVPARLKFLKKDSSEANVISGMVDKLALSHPEISFKFISDQKIKLHTPGNGDLLSAIHAIFGKEFSEALIKVDYEQNGTKVYGYTSNVKASRSNRTLQHFFVNARYVRSKVCTVAVEEGYKSSIMTGKFPFCVLFINVPFNSVDVNVHPAKIEVRFINERAVFDAIYFAIKSSLKMNDELSNAIKSPPKSNPYVLSTFKNEESQQTRLQTENKTTTIVEYNNAPKPANQPNAISDKPSQYEVDTPKIDSQEFKYIDNESFKKPIGQEKKSDKPVIKLEIKDNVIAAVAEAKSITKDDSICKDDVTFRMIGELFKTYILFEVGENFIVVDKHAAHERIIYESLKKSISTQEKQQLLKPEIISVSTSEFDALISNAEELSKMGFSIEEFGNNTVSVREVPLVLTRYNIEEIVIDIAKKLVENKRNITSEVFENLLHSMACRAAIKGNDTNSVEELTELVRLIISNDEIRNCPHGRPVAILSKKTDIEKQFGRI